MTPVPDGKEDEDGDRKKSEDERKGVEEHCVFPGPASTTGHLLQLHDLCGADSAVPVDWPNGFGDAPRTDARTRRRGTDISFQVF